MIAVVAPPGALVAAGDLVLSESESHHLKVRRTQVGEPVRLMDGAGAIAQGTVLSLGRYAAVRVEAVHTHPPLDTLCLVVGAGDKERFEWLVEKAAELGVSEIVPLASSLAQGVATRLRDSHLDRLRRHALEAIKQSGAAWAPAIADFHTPAQVCARFTSGARWLAAQDGIAPVVAGGQPLTAVVGPEGGLTDAERQEFRAAGFLPVRLSPNTLRFETAAIAVAVLARGALTGGPDG